jgi:tryptophan synthase alpha chain
VTGVTGAKTGDAVALDKIVGRIRKLSALPVVIGFGISGPADAVKLAAVADGVVVGSAIVRLVAEHGAAAPAKVEAFVRTLRRALDGEDG